MSNVRRAKKKYGEVALAGESDGDAEEECDDEEECEEEEEEHSNDLDEAAGGEGDESRERRR